MAAAQVYEAVRKLLPLDEPPTLPERTPSGRRIQSKVIRGMYEQHEAVVKACKLLDQLIERASSVTLEGAI